MSRDRRNDTPLSHVIDEIRREPVPSMDWDTMEESLMAQVGRTAVSRPQRMSAAFSPRWAFALAACVLGVTGVVMLRTPQAPIAPAVATHVEEAAPAFSSKLDGHALALGALLSADKDDVVVEHAGHVTWTLKKGSRAHMDSVGEIVALSLDEGEVSAKVVKSLRPETFVVRVEHTRIAVHGTEFVVQRLSSGVHVEVTEGVLGIGPVGGPSFELRAPGAAMLNLDGARADQKKTAFVPQKHASAAIEAHATEEPVAAVVPEAPEATPPPAAAPQPAPAPRKAMPRSAPPAGSEPIVAQASRAVQKCFATHTMAGGDLHVSVRTKMALRVTTDGKVGDALFEPPLAPGVRDCVDRQVGALRFPSSVDGFETTRSLELSR